MLLYSASCKRQTKAINLSIVVMASLLDFVFLLEKQHENTRSLVFLKKNYDYEFMIKTRISANGIRKMIL